MPLTADHFGSVNRYDDASPPLHRQIAEVIRAAIVKGTLLPGETLPGEHDIATWAGVNRATVRAGLDDLVIAGLLVKRSGRPTRVATPPQVRRMSTDRYQETLDLIRSPRGQHPLSSAFTTDHGVDWTEHEVLASYSEERANAEVAERLGLEPTANVLRRRLDKMVRGETVQLQVSVMPLDLVAGTPVADPNRQPWPGGTIAELYSIGQVVTRVLEEARMRRPNAAERQVLGMEVAGPVIEIVRVFYVGPRAVECSTAVVDAARYSLSFETELH